MRVAWTDCAGLSLWTFRDTTALGEGVVFEMGRPSPPGSPPQRREAVRGNPKQARGRSLRGEPRTCRSPLFRNSGRNRFLTVTVRAISRSRPASLSRGSGSQYYRRPGLLGPTADDETLRSAFPSGRQRGERGALSDLRMTWADTRGGGQGMEAIESRAQIFFQNLRPAGSACRVHAGLFRSSIAAFVAQGAGLETRRRRGRPPHNQTGYCAIAAHQW
jgi:hypothetical protein